MSAKRWQQRPQYVSAFRYDGTNAQELIQWVSIVGEQCKATARVNGSGELRLECRNFFLLGGNGEKFAGWNVQPGDYVVLWKNDLGDCVMVYVGADFEREYVPCIDAATWRETAVQTTDAINTAISALNRLRDRVIKGGEVAP